MKTLLLLLLLLLPPSSLLVPFFPPFLRLFSSFVSLFTLTLKTFDEFQFVGSPLHLKLVVEGEGSGGEGRGGRTE